MQTDCGLFKRLLKERYGIFATDDLVKKAAQKIQKAADWFGNPDLEKSDDHNGSFTQQLQGLLHPGRARRFIDFRDVPWDVSIEIMCKIFANSVESMLPVPLAMSSQQPPAEVACSTSGSASCCSISSNSVDLGCVPDDVLGYIFFLVPSIGDYQSISLVCQRWNAVAELPWSWRARFNYRWKFCPLLGSSNGKFSWKEIYQFFHVKFACALSSTGSVAQYTPPMAVPNSSWLPLRDFASSSCPKFQPLVGNAVIAGIGSWIFEVKVGGLSQIGLILPEFFSTIIGYNGVGDDKYSYSFDGYRCRLFHDGYISWGRHWKPGDVVGVGITVSDETILVEYFLNGATMGVGHTIDRASLTAETLEQLQTLGLPSASSGALSSLAAVIPAVSCFTHPPDLPMLINFGPKLECEYPSVYEPIAGEEWSRFWQSIDEEKEDLNPTTTYQTPRVIVVRQKLPYCELRDATRPVNLQQIPFELVVEAAAAAAIPPQLDNVEQPVAAQATDEQEVLIAIGDYEGDNEVEQLLLDEQLTQDLEEAEEGTNNEADPPNNTPDGADRDENDGDRCNIM